MSAAVAGPPPTLIDTHAHLDDDRFRDDLPAVLARARAAGLAAVLTVATDRATSHVNTRLAAAHDLLWASVGIQPNHVAEAAPTDWDEIVRLASSPRVLALGETGLDRYWDRAPFPAQQEYFARHLALGRRTDLPLIIHCREAEADVLAMLRDDFDRHGPIRAVMHSFTGDAATAAACLAMGLDVSFAGMLTYKTAEDLRAVARTVPLDRLLVETDAPYLAPVPVRGRRNEPAFVTHTAARLAAELGLSLADLAPHLTANARRLFAFPA